MSGGPVVVLQRSASRFVSDTTLARPGVSGLWALAHVHRAPEQSGWAVSGPLSRCVGTGAVGRLSPVTVNLLCRLPQKRDGRRFPLSANYRGKTIQIRV